LISINYGQIFNTWIKPELDERKKQGLIKKDFGFTKCLITFPQKSKPVVKFNLEIDITFKIEGVVKEDKEKGDPISIDEVNDIVDVVFSNKEGERIAFIYLQFNGNYSEGALFDVIFDFTPNHSLSDSDQEQSSEIARKSFVKLLRKELRGKIIKYIVQFKDLLILKNKS